MARVAVVLILWLVVCFVVADLMAPTTANVGFKDSASVLAFVSLTAVAIERSIEGFFTLISSRAGQWWPLSVVTSEFDTFEHQTNAVLGDVVTKTLAGLEGAKAAAASNDWKLAEIQRAIDTVTAEHARLRSPNKRATQR